MYKFVLSSEEPIDETEESRTTMIDNLIVNTKMELDRVNRTGKELMQIENGKNKFNIVDKIKKSKRVIKNTLIDNG